MPTFEHDSLTFNYIDTGDPDGRPFVLQHGMGGDVSQPAGLFASRPGGAADLARLPRPRAHEPHRGTRCVDVMADDVIALLDHLGIDRAAVGGVSLGSPLAILRAPSKLIVRGRLVRR